MRRSAAWILVTVLVLVPALWTADAYARAGGGSSGGSRGSRSFSTPVQPSSPNPVSPAAPTSPSTPMQPSPPRPGWGGMLGGLLMGGLIGGLLFGGGHGGMGLLELVVIGGFVYFALKMMRGRRPEPAMSSGYGSAGTMGDGPEQSTTYGGRAATMEPPAPADDLARGVGHLRQLDPSFDPARFAETASDIFFKMQAAWGARDMSRAADVLTPEMQALLQKDCDRMRAEGRINRLENVAVRTAEMTEAWEERGQDYVTVYFLASLLDYTTDETGAKVLDGDATQPVKFEEFWTFARPAGPNPWRLSAIQQPS